MSAAFKLAKKKVSQQDLRRLMKEQKNLRVNDELFKKIDSPFAKYENGQLSCQLCKKTLKEAVWKIHINSSLHKDNLAQAKQLKEKLVTHNKPPTIQERVAAIKEVKKLKGILKNSSQPASTEEAPEDTPTAPPTSSSTLPDDFFDSKPNASQNATSATQEKMQVDEAPIPEGFFDDPVKDRKARNQDPKDPAEEEFLKFQKEIKVIISENQDIINEEQVESTTERQIVEIDAQLHNWSRWKLAFKYYRHCCD